MQCEGNCLRMSLTHVGHACPLVAVLYSTLHRSNHNECQSSRFECRLRSRHFHFWLFRLSADCPAACACRVCCLRIRTCIVEELRWPLCLFSRLAPYLRHSLRRCERIGAMDSFSGRRGFRAPPAQCPHMSRTSHHWLRHDRLKRTHGAGAVMSLRPGRVR